MLFARLLHFTTSQSHEAAAAHLSAAILPVSAIASLKPVRVSDWIARHRGKRFIGYFDGSRFKLVLLQTSRARFRLRGSVVVIVGSVEDHGVRACLRPPWFILGFLLVFSAALSAALALSFLGPSHLPMLQAAMALALVMPIGIVAWFFAREATQAEQALRQVVLGAKPAPGSRQDHGDGQAQMTGGTCDPRCRAGDPNSPDQQRRE